MMDRCVFWFATLLLISLPQSALARPAPLSRENVLGDRPLRRNESLSERFARENELERKKLESKKLGQPPPIFL